MISIDDVMPSRGAADIRAEILRRSHRRLWRRRLGLGTAPVAVGAVLLLLALLGGSPQQTLRSTPADRPSTVEARVDAGSADGTAAAGAEGAGEKVAGTAGRGGNHPAAAAPYAPSAPPAAGPPGASSPTPGAGAAGPPIVFESARNDPSFEIWIMQGDGSGEQRLVPDQGAHDGVLSPDGTHIAYAAPTTDRPARTVSSDFEQQSLFVMPVAGGARRLVYTPSALIIDGVDWSPDGQRLVFGTVNPAVAEVDGNSPGASQEVWTVGVDGSSPAKLTDGSWPRWSPRGDQILFAGDFDRSGIWTIGVDARNRTELTPAGERATDAAWTSDGRIIFVSANTSIDVMKADGSGRRRLYTRSGDEIRSPSWSPDGRSIAFETYLETPTCAATCSSTVTTSIWAIDAAGTHARRLSSGDRDAHPRYPAFASPR